MDELKERGAYKREDYAPFFIASWAQHQFNLMNRRRQIYWVNGLLPNARLHILFVSPAGFMKTYYLNIMAGDELGIFAGCGSHIGFEQEMTAPGFTGTSQSSNGQKIDYNGAAKDYEKGFMLIDEFKGLTEALQGQGNGQFETQLLAALNSGRVVKRLAITRDEYITSFTMWTGIQPSNFTTNSGIGRRLTYLLCLPTEKDNDKLTDIRFANRGKKPDRQRMQVIWSKQKKFIAELDSIRAVEFDDSIRKRYKELGHFHYEAEYYDSLLLGATLAIKGVSPIVEVDLKDPEITKMIENETHWRKQINRNPVQGAISVMLKDAGGECTMDELFNRADMYSLNMEEVMTTVTAMRQNGRIVMSGGKLKLAKMI
jgi:hypothetical protein